MSYFLFWAIFLFHFVSLIIAKTPCNPDSFQFSNSPRSVNKNGQYKFTIDTTSEMGCALNASYEWILYRIEGNKLKRIPQQENVLKYHGRTKMMVNIVDMDKINTEASTNLFAIKVTLIPEATHYSSYRIWYFGIDLFSKMISIDGGDERTHWLDGRSLWLNATVAESEETLNKARNIHWECMPPFSGVQSPNTLKWEIPEHRLAENITHVCTVKLQLPSGQQLSASQIIHIRSTAGLPLILVKCIGDNCNPGDVNKETVLKYFCYANCKGKVSWTVRPYSENYLSAMQISSAGDSVTFKAATFKPESIMDFIVAMGDATANYTLTFKMQEPKFEIKCRENCVSFNSEHEMKFEVICKSDCKGLIYEWWSHPSPKKHWTSNHPNNNIIILPPESFPQKTKVNLTAQSGSAITAYVFETNSGDVDELPKIVISCLSNCGNMDFRGPIVMKVECKRNCDGIDEYTWSFEPTLPGFHWRDHATDRNQHLIIPAYTFKDGQIIQASVFAAGGTDKAIMPFKALEPNIKIECIVNCEKDDSHPDARKTVVVKANCASQCNYGSNIWRLQPEPQGYNYLAKQLDASGTNFTIPAGLYKDGDSVEVFVTRNNKEVSLSITYAKLKPKIAIACLHNCMTPPDPLIDTILRINCTKLCMDVSYEWRLTPAPKLWLERIELTDNNKTIIVKGGTFDDKDSVHFGVYTQNDVEAHYDLKYEYPKVNMTINCQENCNNSWISSKTDLIVKCVSNCNNASYLWSFSPLPDNFKWGKSILLSSDNKTLTILPYSFKHKDNITFKVDVVMKIGQTVFWKATDQKAELKIEFEELIPIITLSCEPKGCNATVNRFEEVALAVKCMAKCGESAYTWNIDPKPSGFNWDTNTIRGIENNTLKILPKTAKDGDNITISVSKGPAKRVAYFIFKDPAPVLEIVCEKNNCSPSNSMEPVRLRAQCYYLCEYIDVYNWDLQPPAKTSPNTGPRSATLTIPANAFDDGDIVNASVGWRKTTSYKQLTFFRPVPMLKITCLRNCKYNPKIDTTFQALCSANCYGNSTYEWVLTPSPKKQVTYIDNRKETLTFPAESYEDFDRINVTVSSGKGQNTIIIVFVVGKYKLVIECIKNCDSNLIADPREATQFSVVCEECSSEHVSYKWVLDQAPISFNPKTDVKYTRENSFMTIRANLYKNNTIVRIYAQSGHSNASLDVNFFYPSPVLLLLCVENCGFPDPYMDVTVNVTCLEHCNRVNYIWDISPKPRDFSWQKNIKLGVSNKTLTLKQNTYQDNEQILFIVQSENVKAELLLTFTVPAPILKISCRPDCKNADPLGNLTLEVTCLQFCHNPFYNWNLKPTLPGFAWQLNTTELNSGSMIIIKENTFVDGSLVNAVVVSNKSAFAMIEIHYVLKAPKMTLTFTRNRIFHPRHSVLFEVKCTENCNHFEFNCTFTPPPPDPDDIEYRHEGIVYISKDIYRDKEEVTIRCTSRKSYVQEKISYRLVPFDLDCSVVPNEGTSAVTEHTVDCVETMEVATYRVYQAIPSLPLFGLLLWHGHHAHIPNLWFASENGTANIVVVLGESFDVKAAHHMDLTVHPIVKDEQWSVLKYRILGKRLNDFKSLLKTRQFQKAVQLASALDSALEHCPPPFEFHYRRHILEGILSASENIEPSQVLHLMTKVSIKEYGQSLALYHLIIEGLRSSIERLALSSPSTSGREYDSKTFINITGEALYVVGRVIKVSSLSGEINENYLPQSADYVENAGPRRHLQYITNDIVRIIDAVCDMVTESEETIYLKTPTIFTKTVHTNSFYETTTINVKENRSEVTFYPMGVNDPRLKPTEVSNVTLKVGLIRGNPFWWDLTLSTLLGEYVFVALRVNTTIVQYTTFDIIISRTSPKRPWKAGKLRSTISLTLVIYEFNVPPYSTFEASFEGENLTASISNWVPSAESIEKYGIRINKTNMNKLIYYYSELPTLYLGITGRPNSIFSMKFASILCYAWHGDSWAWNLQDCRAKQPQPKNPRFVTCQCSRLSIFTANKTIPRYSLKTDVRDDDNLQGELKILLYVTITTVIVTIAIVFAVFFATKMDKTIQQKYKLQCVSDNDPRDKVMYLVAVQTGVWFNSGTTARVAVQLIGKIATSKVHVLNANSPTLLQRNSADCFVIYSPVCLGKITALRVWHDSHGQKPHWYCCTIVVRDVATRKRYIFLVSRWFSLLFGNGQTSGIFYPKKKRTVANFSTKSEEALRKSFNYLGCLTNRAYPHIVKQNVAVSCASILLTMLMILLLMPNNGPLDIWRMIPYIFMVAIISEVVSTLIDALIRMSA